MSADPTVVTPISPELASHLAPFSSPEIVPNNGFMIDAEGVRIQSVYKTPRACIRCGSVFIPQRRKNGMASIPEVCSYTCRADQASKQMTAIGQEAREAKENKRHRVLASDDVFGPPPSSSTLADPIPSDPDSDPDSLADPAPAPTPISSKQPRNRKGRFERKNAAVTPTPFATALRRLRKEHDMTAEDVASKLGCSPNAVFNWERGNSMIPTDKFVALADIFDVSWEALWYGTV